MPSTMTPLRYPGGKSQLYNFIKNTLVLNHVNIKNQGLYIEPFSGGCGVAIKLLLKNDIQKIIINDLDPAIYTFWHSVLYQTEDLIAKIQTTPVTIKEWENQHSIYKICKNNLESLDLAFATFFLNRTNRSGIIRGGPIGGMSQAGKYKLDCRFNKENLIEKIRAIAGHRSNISLYNLDASTLISNVLCDKDPEHSFLFFDPPYYNQGGNLYENSLKADDHLNLHSTIVSLNDFYWITTYDYQEKIADIYHDCVGFKYSLTYSASNKRREWEYLFTNKKTKLKSYRNVKLLPI